MTNRLPDTLALLDLPASELRQILEQDRTSDPAALTERVRAEASRFYHSDSSRARAIAARALEIGVILGDPKGIGWGYRAMAEAALFSGRIREAESLYVKAAASWRDAGDLRLLGELLVGYIHVLSLVGKEQEADQTAREARRLLEKAGHNAYLAKLAMNLGNKHFQMDHHALALQEYDRAASLFRKLGIRDESTLGLEINRAVALTQLDRVDEALDLFQKLQVDTEKRGYDLLRAQVLMNVAYVHSQRADFDLALSALSRATDYFASTDHPAFLASCQVNRAEIYHQLNLHGEALAMAERAAPLFRQEEMKYDEALARTLSAFALLAAGRAGEAMAQVRKARGLFENLANPARVALAQLLMAEILYRRRRAEESAMHATAAMEAFRRFGLLRWEVSCAVLLAQLGRTATPCESRVHELRRLLGRVPHSLYPLARSRLLEALALAQEEAAQIPEAVRTYRAAIEGIEGFRIRIPSEDSKISFLQDRAVLYDRVLALETSRGRTSTDKVLSWMERSRAQSLWDRLCGPSAEALPAGSDRGVTATRRRLAWLHSRLSRLELGSSAERAQIQEVRKRLLDTEREWNRLLREREERRGSSARPDTARVVTIEEIAGRLPRGWGFVSFHIGDPCALAVVVTREGSTWRRLGDGLRERIERLGDRLDHLWNTAAVLSARQTEAGGARPGDGLQGSGLDGPLQERADSILRDLHRLLWKPIEEMTADASLRWIVSLHGPAHRIPLHALRDKRGYLIERSDFSYVPSGRIWSGLPRTTRGGKRVAYVAGVPSASLPAVEREIERVSGSLRNWAVHTDLSPHREEARLRASSADLIHLAAHGSLRRENPAFSFLQLTDGPLFVHDLKDWRIPSSTVVLSACSSGRSVAPAGDEWIGLARGFLQAGAATVVASLWPIEDAPTVELVERFYEGFARGLPSPLALGNAMREMMIRRPHPWHWASFAAVAGV